MNRHWERIAKITKCTFDIENENFQLRNLMEAPLLQNKEDIEVSISVQILLHFIENCGSRGGLIMA